MAECASACRDTNGCQFFVYGTRWKAGYCYWEKTASADCPEGWEDDNYDFFSLSGKYHCLHLSRSQRLSREKTGFESLHLSFYSSIEPRIDDNNDDELEDDAEQPRCESDPSLEYDDCEGSDVKNVTSFSLTTRSGKKYF